MSYNSAEQSTHKAAFIFSVRTVFFHSLQLQNIVPTSTNAAISILYPMAAATSLHYRFTYRKQVLKLTWFNIWPIHSSVLFFFIVD